MGTKDNAPEQKGCRYYNAIPGNVSANVAAVLLVSRSPLRGWP